MKTLVIVLKPENAFKITHSETFKLSDEAVFFVADCKDNFRILFGCEAIPENPAKDHKVFITGESYSNTLTGEKIFILPALIDYEDASFVEFDRDTPVVNVYYEGVLPLFNQRKEFILYKKSSSSVANGKIFASLIVSPDRFDKNNPVVELSGMDFFRDDLENIAMLPPTEDYINELERCDSFKINIIEHKKYSEFKIVYPDR